MCLGGFKNLRRDYSWEGFKLELDETQFDWGTVYEVEVETVRAARCTAAATFVHVLSLPDAAGAPRRAEAKA